MPLDSIDRKLLNLLQNEFPLEREPYAAIGLRLHIDAGTVLERIERLKQQGIIRLIGPVLDSRRLGYQTTLVAMTVPQTALKKAELAITQHSGVSHGYERDHRFNLWFTLAVPPSVDIDTEVQQLVHSTGAQTAVSLPSIRVFKIGTYFDMEENGTSTFKPVWYDTSVGQVELSRKERSVINGIQCELPLVQRTFDNAADKLGMDVDDLLSCCRSLQQRGIIRRFSAFINHNCAGFVANAMSCWAAPPDILDAAANTLAALKEVSHCYERKTNSLWPYNLFAMIHCHTKERCEKIAAGVSRQCGLPDYVLLYSTREFKKIRIKYPV